MNLTLSGPASPSLREAVATTTHATDIVRLNERAVRLLSVTDAPDVRSRVADLCEVERVDHAFLPDGIHLSDYRVLAMDMDSTLITIECIDELADIAGKKAEVSAITEAAMRGEMDFRESLEKRVAFLKGLAYSALDEVMHTRLKLTDGACELVEAAKAHGLKLLLVSGGFTYFADQLRRQLGLDYTAANSLQAVDGILTGALEGTIVDAQVKQQIIEAFASTHGFAMQQCIAVGDGANDIPMLQASGLPIAYKAKPQTQRAASQIVRYGGLQVILDWID